MTFYEVLLPQQRESNHQSGHYETEEILPITKNQMMEACNRMENGIDLGLDGTPDIAF